MDRETQLAQAGQLIDSGSYESAIRDYSSIIEEDGYSPRLFGLRGYAYYRADMFREAIADLSRSTSDVPSAANSLFILGKCKAETGDLNGALDAFRLAFKADPSAHDALTEMGMIYRYRGQDDLALQVFNQALAICPASKGAQNGRHDLLSRVST